MPLDQTTLRLLMATMITFAGAAMTSTRTVAQSAPKADCEVAAPTTAPTKTEKGPDSGTKNPGSTAWSGATGGSNNDTTQAGPQPGSPTEHPATAKGLDPIKPQASKKPC